MREARIGRKQRQIDDVLKRLHQFASAEQWLLEAHTEEDIADALLRIESLNEGMSRQDRRSQLLEARRKAEDWLDQADEEDHPADFICEWVARSIGCGSESLKKAASQNFRGEPDLVDRLHQRDEAGDSARLLAILSQNEYLARHRELAGRIGLKSTSTGQVHVHPAMNTTAVPQSAAVHCEGAEQGDAQKATRAEANEAAMKLAAADSNFPHLTRDKWAKRIAREIGKSCSSSLVGKLPFWEATMKEMGRGRTRGSRKPKAVGTGELVEQLAAEQREDYEPSPFEKSPLSVKVTKRP